MYNLLAAREFHKNGSNTVPSLQHLCQNKVIESVCVDQSNPEIVDHREFPSLVIQTKLKPKYSLNEDLTAINALPLPETILTELCCRRRTDQAVFDAYAIYKTVPRLNPELFQLNIRRFSFCDLNDKLRLAFRDSEAAQRNHPEGIFLFSLFTFGGFSLFFQNVKDGILDPPKAVNICYSGH